MKQSIMYRRGIYHFDIGEPSDQKLVFLVFGSFRSDVLESRTVNYILDRLY